MSEFDDLNKWVKSCPTKNMGYLALAIRVLIDMLPYDQVTQITYAALCRERELRPAPAPEESHE